VKRKTLVAVCLVLVLLMGVFAIHTLAQNSDLTPTVVYDHGQKHFQFQNVSPYEGNTYPNLFADADFTAMMPGDAVEQDILVTAKNLKSGYAELYLYAQSLNDDITAEEAKNFDLLMENATVLVSWTGHDGNLYHDELEAAGGRVHLGTFYNGTQVTINVNFGLDIEAGNDLQFLRAEVGWVFVAEVYEKLDPGPGSPDTPGNPGDPGRPINPPGFDIPQLEKEDHFAYIIGRDDGLVHPEAYITRGEVATIFFRVLTDASREHFWAQTNPYLDVYGHEWFNNAVSTLTKARILKGLPDGTFAANRNITRAEFATIAARFFIDEHTTYESDAFSDIAGHWANHEINFAAAKGLINGYPDGTFGPNRLISRAEAMAILNRLLERYPDKDHLLPDMITWPDNMNTHVWYYADVQEATNSHTYDKQTTPSGVVYEVWKALEPVRDWEALEKEWSDHDSSVNPGEVVSSKNNAAYK